MGGGLIYREVMGERAKRAVRAPVAVGAALHAADLLRFPAQRALAAHR